MTLLLSPHFDYYSLILIAISWSRLATLQWYSGLWNVNSLQTLCWEIGDKIGSLNEVFYAELDSLPLDLIRRRDYSSRYRLSNSKLVSYFDAPGGLWQDGSNSFPLRKFSSPIDGWRMVMRTAARRPATVQYQRPGHAVVGGVLQSHWLVAELVRRCGLPTARHQLQLQYARRPDLHRVGDHKARVALLVVVVKPLVTRTQE